MWLLALLLALLAALGVDPCVQVMPDGTCVPASQAG